VIPPDSLALFISFPPASRAKAYGTISPSPSPIISAPPPFPVHAACTYLFEEENKMVGDLYHTVGAAAGDRLL